MLLGVMTVSWLCEIKAPLPFTVTDGSIYDDVVFRICSRNERGQHGEEGAGPRGARPRDARPRDARPVRGSSPRHSTPAHNRKFHLKCSGL